MKHETVNNNHDLCNLLATYVWLYYMLYMRLSMKFENCIKNMIILNITVHGYHGGGLGKS